MVWLLVAVNKKPAALFGGAKLGEPLVFSKMKQKPYQLYKISASKRIVLHWGVFLC